jgi:hypothetical protein
LNLLLSSLASEEQVSANVWQQGVCLLVHGSWYLDETLDVIRATRSIRAYVLILRYLFG